MKKKTSPWEGDRPDIRLPYCNWSKFRSLQYTPEDTDDAVSYDNSVEFRTRSVLGLAIKNTEEKNRSSTWAEPVQGIDLKETEFLTFTEARLLATVRFAYLMREAKTRGLPLGESAEACGMDRTSAARFVSSIKKINIEYVPAEGGTQRVKLETEGKVRGFTASTRALPVIADRLTDCTLHQLLFGEEKEIVLPGKYSYIAEKLEQIQTASHQNLSTEADIETLLRVGSRLWQKELKEYKEQNPEDRTFLPGDGQIKPSWKLLRQRILELCYDSPYTVNPKLTFLHSTGGPSQLKLSLDEICSKNIQKEREGKTDEMMELNIEYYMLFALESGQAVDFFIANDYVGYLGCNGNNMLKARKNTPDIYYKDSLGNKKQLTDEKILAIMSYCTALNDEDRNDYMSTIMVKIWKNL